MRRNTIQLRKRRRILGGFGAIALTGLVLAGMQMLPTKTVATMVTGSLGGAPQPMALDLQPRGASGLPLPRYVSLKGKRVNVRVGPSQDHDVAWVFTRPGLPVEIIAEFGNWRRIRDSEGAEGWVYHSLLSGKRTALTAPWQLHGGADALLAMRRAPDAGARLAARLEHGALVRVEECAGGWCAVRASGIDGYLKQEQLWGVYPGETVR